MLSPIVTWTLMLCLLGLVALLAVSWVELDVGRVPDQALPGDDSVGEPTRPAQEPAPHLQLQTIARDRAELDLYDQEMEEWLA